MFKYVTSQNVKATAFSLILYLVVLGLTLLEREELTDLFYGKILLVLIYIGPILILFSFVKDVIRERERSKNDD